MNALDSAVINGLDIARRIGWDSERSLWQFGLLYRVYYVPSAELADGEQEPDKFNRGIAPSIKLLHAAVSRLADIDISKAIEFVRRWKHTNSPVHLRLWAALSRDSRVSLSNEVSTLLLSLDDRCFWDLEEYPEIAELRAVRFGDFDTQTQAALTARILKTPPRNQWPSKADAERVKSERLYWAVRELRRIQISGAFLPTADNAWMDKNIHQFSDLVHMTRLDEGFLYKFKDRWLQPNPDDHYDLLEGEERLKALEIALTTTRHGWDNNPARRAGCWIEQPENHMQILADLESVADGGASFVKIWERFGWAHTPMLGKEKNTAQRDLLAESIRVLSLLDRLPNAILRNVINGISQWFSAWKKQVTIVPEGLCVWLKLWPIAVEITNALQPREEESSLNTVAQSSDDSEPMNLDTLNTPVGKLVGVFLAACPTIKSGDTSFSENNIQRQMRDAVEASIGTAGLIVKYRLIEGLNYFLKADFEWARSNLVPPLLEDNDETRILWRAVARRVRFFDELKVIGDQMVDRATDHRLSRDTRKSLVFSLVIECLHAFREQRDPAVSYVRIQQMIRSLDDEVRAYGADAVQRFVHDLSMAHEGGQTPPSPKQLFIAAVDPFFQKVWPQERSLSTSGVSQALANLPATTQEAFVEAVDSIKRFLVPFECWSMLDYGLYGEEESNSKLLMIDNTAKADALLQLLDLTIGTAEGAIIPHDLADALNQVRKVAPKLSESQVFRRLATAARRG